jgi:hypothetical protein
MGTNIKDPMTIDVNKLPGDRMTTNQSPNP